MEIGKQIKKYRIAMKLSQDALAEKIFVSRHGPIIIGLNEEKPNKIKGLHWFSPIFLCH